MKISKIADFLEKIHLFSLKMIYVCLVLLVLCKIKLSLSKWTKATEDCDCFKHEVHIFNAKTKMFKKKETIQFLCKMFQVEETLYLIKWAASIFPCDCLFNTSISQEDSPFFKQIVPSIDTSFLHQANRSCNC